MIDLAFKFLTDLGNIDDYNTQNAQIRNRLFKKFTF